MRLTIESNVSIRANATQEQLDTAGVFDLLLICYALRFQVCGVAVQDVDVRWVDIDMAEEVLVHK